MTRDRTRGAATAPPLDALILAPVAPVRAYLILRCTLLLLGVDVWMTLLGPAWRYGAAGFNVPHFAWMNALPMPTTSSYVAALALISGFSMLASLLERPPRALIVAIAVLYTWAWSSSMLDSYQHHYLVSWVLLTLAFFPTLDATALFGAPGARPSATQRTYALGPKLVWILAAVVYGYTAVSKTEPDWIDGSALSNITGDGAAIPRVVAFFSRLGWAGDDFWWLMGHATILVQIVCALGYVAAIVRDIDVAPAGLKRAAAVLTTLALFAAVSFHVGAEYLGLEIGWFSYYMIVLSVASFAPAPFLVAVTAFVTWPSRALAARADVFAHPVVPAATFVGAAAALLYAASEAGLPGVLGAAFVVAFVAAVVGAVERAMRPASRAPLASALSMVCTALVMTVALRVGEERYDFWRFAGGDFRRRGETHAALDAYRNALRFAPEASEADDEATSDGEARPAREAPRERMARNVRALEAAVASESAP